MNKEIAKFWKTQWEAYLKSFFAMRHDGCKFQEDGRNVRFQDVDGCEKANLI
ncbi:MAG: hypothetical protein H6Q50_862 [Deltaproteobacteria bacterium]|nr:hypothetical protein [Deltaproteobacteria bacterium]